MSKVGFKHTDETRQKISEAHKGKKHTAESRKKMSLAKMGKKLSVAHREKIGKANTGKKHTAEALEKMSKAHRGKKMSEESKQKCRDTFTAKRADGYISPLQGKKFSEVHRENLSKAHKGKKQTAETIEKRRKALKGKKHTDETKKKLSEAKRGSNNPQWNQNREEVASNRTVRRYLFHHSKWLFNDDQEAISCLGYTKEEFLSNIEEGFYPGMRWDNRGKGKGKWQVHHVLPLSWFVKRGITSPRILNALDNLKPLWGHDHTDEHKRLRKFIKKEKEFWVELFVWHVEYSQRKPLSMLARTPIDLSINVNKRQRKALKRPIFT